MNINRQQSYDILQILHHLQSYNKPCTYSLNQINYSAHKLNQCIDNEQYDNMLNHYRSLMNHGEFNLLKCTALYLNQA